MNQHKEEFANVVGHVARDGSDGSMSWWGWVGIVLLILAVIITVIGWFVNMGGQSGGKSVKKMFTRK
jgi:hypothetical protein